jgi:hypothetical protein
MQQSARRLCRLVFWVKEKMQGGIQIDPYDFTNASLVEAMQEDEGKDIDKWIQQETELTNYLSTKKVIRGIPLAYVI